MLSENTVKESLGVTGAVKLRLMQKLKDEINSDYPCISRMEEIIEEIKVTQRATCEDFAKFSSLFL